MESVFLLKDLARVSGYSTHTIKYYLKVGLFKETGRCPETRFRYFNDASLNRLKQIRQLRKQKKSIREILESFNS